jgi:hypothetical protein
MGEIVIRIQVPDGTNVRVEQGGARSGGSDKPFVERPAPPEPNDGGCPVHDVDWKLVPAGFSKNKTNADGTPKRYNAFWACPERGCDQKPTWDDTAPAGGRGNSDGDDLPF